MSQSNSFLINGLGIPADRCPPDHYTLLGLQRFESRRQVIEQAVERRMQQLKSQQMGRYRKECQQLLNQVAKARLCLTQPASKHDYDLNLKAQLRSTQLPPLPEQLEKLSPADLPMRTPDHLRVAFMPRTAPQPPRSARVLTPLREWLTDWRWKLPAVLGVLAILGLAIALLFRLAG